MSIVPPVELAPEPGTETKRRTVTIVKARVYKDVELFSHKHVDGSQMTDVRQRNAVEADTAEPIDGRVVKEYVEYRDAMLRDRFQYALAQEEVESADNSLDEDDNFVYNFDVSVDFKDAALRPLALFIHRYLLVGALFDWYSQFGSAQASVYEKQLTDLENTIDGTLRVPAAVKAPHYPFGRPTAMPEY